MEVIRLAPQSPALTMSIHMHAVMTTYVCVSAIVCTEILRVVYNLQSVAFPEGQIRRCPRLIVVQRHERSDPSCRKHQFVEKYP